MVIYTTKTKKYVSDVLNIDQLIANGKYKIFLIAGVGSGKSRWVTEVLTQKGNVLFVTSRKAKVLEDINYSCFSDVFDFNTYNNQTLITNAKLASLVERFSDDYTEDLECFISHFDYFVIDEVHSIASDSAYAESCSSVLSFIEYVASKEKPIICMTGTPEPIQRYFDENGWYTIDYTNICNYVHPKRISLIQKRHIISNLKQTISSQKIIYFTNHTNAIISLCNALLEENIVSPSEIAISVSKSREEDFFEELFNNLATYDDGIIIQASSCREYENIIENSRLTDECKILISTSVLKEGINIKNPDMVLFCENHILSNLIQYFGRARIGQANVFIIEDSESHPIAHNELLYDYAVHSEVAAANRFYKEIVESPQNPFSKVERSQLSAHIIKNPYIYFDYISQEYKVFSVKFFEEKRLIKQQKVWKTILLKYCQAFNIEPRWFDKKETYQRILLDLARKKTIFYGKEDKETLLNIISTAYDIEKKQPKGINDELRNNKAPICLYNGKGSSGNKRNVSFWQLLLTEDYKTT